MWHASARRHARCTLATQKNQCPFQNTRATIQLPSHPHLCPSPQKKAYPRELCQPWHNLYHLKSKTGWTNEKERTTKDDGTKRKNEKKKMMTRSFLVHVAVLGMFGMTRPIQTSRPKSARGLKGSRRLSKLGFWVDVGFWTNLSRMMGDAKGKYVKKNDNANILGSWVGARNGRHDVWGVNVASATRHN